METLKEILRRVRFVWALLWLAITAYVTFSTNAWLPLRVLAPTLAWLPFYLHIPGGLKLGLPAMGMSWTLAFLIAAEGNASKTLDMLAVGGIAFAVFTVIGFMLTPLFNRSK